VHLDPIELERLLVFGAAELARRSRADGAQLSAPEAVAIVTDEMHRAARRGATYAEVADVARTAVDADELQEGIADLVPELRVEVLLDEGMRLFTIDSPFGVATTHVAPRESPMVLNEGRSTVELEVLNTSSRPVRVSSHFPFWQANHRLSFEREKSVGYRLDLPAGDTVRWAPGERKRVRLVAYSGTSEPGSRESAPTATAASADESEGGDGQAAQDL
jgi:urease subunit gamma/beta